MARPRTWTGVRAVYLVRDNAPAGFYPPAGVLCDGVGGLTVDGHVGSSLHHRLRPLVRGRADRGAPPGARERGAAAGRVGRRRGRGPRRGRGWIARGDARAGRARRGADAPPREATLRRQDRRAPPRPDRERRGVVLRGEGGQATARVRGHGAHPAPREHGGREGALDHAQREGRRRAPASRLALPGGRGARLVPLRDRRARVRLVHDRGPAPGRRRGDPPAPAGSAPAAAPAPRRDVPHPRHRRDRTRPAARRAEGDDGGAAEALPLDARSARGLRDHVHGRGGRRRVHREAAGALGPLRHGSGHRGRRRGTDGPHLDLDLPRRDHGGGDERARGSSGAGGRRPRAARGSRWAVHRDEGLEEGEGSVDPSRVDPRDRGLRRRRQGGVEGRPEGGGE